MPNQTIISLIARDREHLLSINRFLQEKGYLTKTFEDVKSDEIQNSDLVILCVDELDNSLLNHINTNFNKQPLIIHYNNCKQDIANLESFENVKLYFSKDIYLLPFLIRNALSEDQNIASKPENGLIQLLDSILDFNINKIAIEEFIPGALSLISDYNQASGFHFFVLPAYKSFNLILEKTLIDEFNINKLEELYPEIDFNAFIPALKNNQELIIFNKNQDGQKSSDNIDSQKSYYCLVLTPVIFNSALCGCIVFRFSKALENIDQIRKQILYLSKFFSFQLQYKIVHNQYEKSIHQFSRLINNAINGIYQSTEEGRIIYANPSFLKIVGYDSLEELQEVDLFTQVYTSKSDREKFIEKIKQEKAVHNYESLIRKKDGDIINVIENSRIVTNPDGSVLFEGIIQDITHQINLKEKLKYQTSFSEKIVENAPFMIVAVDANKEVILWNAKAEETSGYDRHELYHDKNIITRLIENIDFHLLEPEAQVPPNYDKKYDDFELTSKDGSKKVIRWSWIVNDYLADDNRLLLGFGLDVTKTKILEDQLFESQKMESIGTLAAGMAYDFNKILNELNVYNSSLKSIMSEESKENQYVRRIEDTINKASAYTSKLIGISRPIRKKKLELDVNNSINYVIDLIEHTASEGVEIEKEVCQSPIIKGDVSQIQQVLLNVALNANESIEGRGKISFKTDIVMAKSDEFLHSLNPPKPNYVRITISDTGKGIPPELYKRIFDPFFTTKQSGKSSGLGLSVAYNIVKNHKGYIFVDSKSEKGSQFYIYFPYIGEPLSGYNLKDIDDEEFTQPEVTVKENPQILVVDDEVIIRDLLNDVLIEHSYEVLLAKDGFEGLDLFKKYQNSIDLIILDVIMPGMSGKEVFDRVRQIDPKTKIIITSGYSKQKVTESLMSAGANGFLPKPFNLDKLLGLIKALIEEN